LKDSAAVAVDPHCFATNSPIKDCTSAVAAAGKMRRSPVSHREVVVMSYYSYSDYSQI
jgi:hypothetical protein